MAKRQEGSLHKFPQEQFTASTLERVLEAKTKNSRVSRFKHVTGAEGTGVVQRRD